MANPDKTNKKKQKSRNADRNMFRPPARQNAIDPNIIAKEFSLYLGNQCSTRLDVAFIAAEMLLHIGRGQMAAQLGHNYSHLSNSDLNTITTETAVLEYPAMPTQDSVVENLFMGFVKSIANSNPGLKKERWKTAGNGDLPTIAALSFLVGNMAWQNRTGSGPMTRQNVKDAFDAVSGTHCPPPVPPFGSGRFCDWMDL